MKSPEALLRVGLLFMTLFTFACGRSAFRFQVTFPEATGIKEGCEVRYLGIRVGSVERVFFQSPTNGGRPEVVVALALEDQRIQVRRDDSYRVSSMGLLGPGMIEIIPGPSNSPPVLTGSTVKGEVPTLEVNRFSTYFSMLELAAKLDSLPKEKRDELLKSFHDSLNLAIRTAR